MFIPSSPPCMNREPRLVPQTQPGAFSFGPSLAAFTSIFGSTAQPPPCVVDHGFKVIEALDRGCWRGGFPRPAATATDCGGNGSATDKESTVCSSVIGTGIQWPANRYRRSHILSFWLSALTTDLVPWVPVPLPRSCQEAAKSICMAENRRTTGGAMLAGAALAAVAAWLLEASHHPTAGVVLVVAFAVLPGLLVDWHHPTPVGRLAVWCYNLPPYVRAGLALALVGINILIEAQVGRNAITHYYAPLLPAVAAAGVLFGPATGLLAAVAAVVAADLIFPAPETDFSMTEGHSIALVAGFGCLGAMVGWAVWTFLDIAREEAANSELYSD
jgi:hypothetical protein